jgi:hypothetical protein
MKIENIFDFFFGVKLGTYKLLVSKRPVSQVRGFKPGLSRRIFKGEKSSALPPSDGK